MQFIKNVVAIITRRDIHWLELLILWITGTFFLVLLAPGDYFAVSPQLRHLERHVLGLNLSEPFWTTIFAALLFVQALGIIAGDDAIGFKVTRAKRFAFSPYLIRMRALAMGVGVWMALAILIYPGGQAWPLHLAGTFFLFHVSLACGIFTGLAVFSFAGSLRMAAQVSVQRQDSRRAEILREAAEYLRIMEEVKEMEMPRGAATQS